MAAGEDFHDNSWIGSVYAGSGHKAKLQASEKQSESNAKAAESSYKTDIDG